MKPFLPFVCVVSLCMLTGVANASPSGRKSLDAPKNGLTFQDASSRKDSLSMYVSLLQGQDKFALQMSLENFLEGKVTIELISEDGSILFL